MRQSRFADEQMVAIVREADREPVADVAKRHGVSEQTIYVWRKRFGTLAASEVRRLKALEAENARLKKLVAERDLEIEVMKEIAVENGGNGGGQSLCSRSSASSTAAPPLSAPNPTPRGAAPLAMACPRQGRSGGLSVPAITSSL